MSDGAGYTVAWPPAPGTVVRALFFRRSLGYGQFTDFVEPGPIDARSLIVVPEAENDR